MTFKILTSFLLHILLLVGLVNLVSGQWFRYGGRMECFEDWKYCRYHETCCSGICARYGDYKKLKSNAIERRNFLAPCLKFDDQKFEFIFVLDRSTSMRGDKIILARRAVALFLRSLPSTCIFNVIGFGGSFEKLYSSSVQYSQSTLEQATRSAEGMGANLRGTALMPPLQAIYGASQTAGYLTQIFVLTDGQCERVGAVTNLIRRNKPFARVFSLGIGRDASVALVKGIAAEGGGVAEFVIASNEKIETKILEQLKIALKPSLLKAIPV